MSSAFSAQVAEWSIAVGDETGALVAHSARSLRRGVGPGSSRCYGMIRPQAEGNDNY